MLAMILLVGGFGGSGCQPNDPNCHPVNPLVAWAAIALTVLLVMAAAMYLTTRGPKDQ